MPESRLTLPADVTDTLSLRRTLASIIREIDIITGAKGVDPYVRQSELPNIEIPEVEVSLDSIVALREELTRLSDRLTEFDSKLATIESTVQDISDEVATLSNVKEYEQAPAAMSDFNDTSWVNNFGLFQLSLDGADFTNPPEVLDDTTLYNMYALVNRTLNGGAVHEVTLEDTVNAATKVYRRAGSTAAQTIANGWFNVQSY